jgi:F-type H+-transporting ATPase subunit alpha
LELAQYRALAAFAQFGSELDPASQKQLNRGQRLTELLKQPQFQPLPVEKQILIIYAGTNGFVDDLPVDACRRFEAELYPFIESAFPSLLPTIREKRELKDDLKAELSKALTEFKTRFQA